MRSLWCRLEARLKQHLANGRRRHRNPKPFELADDPFVTPVRVLPCEPQDQLAERALKPRSPGPPVRIGPPARDQLPMPAKQRLRLEREDCPGGSGQRATQRRQQRSISPRQFRLRRRAAEDCQLMAQDEDLELLRAMRPPSSHTKANRFRTTRYTSDQSKAASLVHDASAEPSELDAPTNPGRVCEPYGLNFSTVFAPSGCPT